MKATAMRNSGLEKETVMMTARTSKLLKRKALICPGIIRSTASMSLENLLTMEPEEVDSKNDNCPFITRLKRCVWINLLAAAAQRKMCKFLQKATIAVASPIPPYTAI